ncbi:MAG: c-type cytochrome [Azoarcus sp.]|nr:c-type cytochrome [Azoarcus sp.]
MKAILTAIAAASLLCAAPAFADEALAKSKNCMACHATDKKLVGPSYKDVAAKYAGQGDAVAYLVGKIKGGSSGVWGPVPMPPNAVSDDEANKLAEWVLGQK